MVIRGVSASEKLLLLVLANYANESMSCWPSHKRLSDDACLSQRTVLTLLRSLEEKRIISRRERQREDGSRTTDVITMHFSGEVVSPPPETISPRGEAGDTGVGKQLQGGGEMVSPLTTFEPSPKPSDETDDGDGAGEPDWDLRLAEAKEAGGEALDLTATALWTYRDLRALCEPSSGEPCLWGEVVDAIRFRAGKWKAQGGPKIRSWTWVRDQALAYRDRRIAGLRAPEAVAQGPPSITDRIAAERAESERLAFAMLDARNG